MGGNKKRERMGEKERKVGRSIEFPVADSGFPTKCATCTSTLKRILHELRSAVHGFGVTLKIRKKSKFDRNQLKLATQHKYMYMYQIKL